MSLGLALNVLLSFMTVIQLYMESFIMTFKVQLYTGHFPDYCGPFWYWSGKDEMSTLNSIAAHYHRSVSDFCIVEKTKFIIIEDDKIKHINRSV